MKVFLVVSALLAVAMANPGAPNTISIPAALFDPIPYRHVGYGASTGPDGRVLDTPEVAYAKAQNAAAHINARITWANEADKSTRTYSIPRTVPGYKAPTDLPAYSARVSYHRYAGADHGTPVAGVYSDPSGASYSNNIW